MNMELLMVVSLTPDIFALESLQAGRCHTHTIHMPYTCHTHTIPLSMATIWHHREKTEASPCMR